MFCCRTHSCISDHQSTKAQLSRAPFVSECRMCSKLTTKLFDHVCSGSIADAVGLRAHVRVALESGGRGASVNPVWLCDFAHVRNLHLIHSSDLNLSTNCRPSTRRQRSITGCARWVCVRAGGVNVWVVG
jgi:hypothetical protein